MKKTLVLLYDGFCNFEISVALETLALFNKPVDYVGHKHKIIVAEEGFKVIVDKLYLDIDLTDYDSLLLPGAIDIIDVVNDHHVIDFIDKCSKNKMIIGAISIAPILLLKANLLNDKPFMIGANFDDLIAEGFEPAALTKMVDWNQSIEKPINDGYLLSNNIITSVSYNFTKFGIAFCQLLEININPATFGINKGYTI